MCIVNVFSRRALYFNRDNSELKYSRVLTDSLRQNIDTCFLRDNYRLRQDMFPERDKSSSTISAGDTEVTRRTVVPELNFLGGETLISSTSLIFSIYKLHQCFIILFISVYCEFFSSIVALEMAMSVCLSV